MGRIRNSKDDNFGYNAETGEFGDMIKAGVITQANSRGLPCRMPLLS